MANGPKDDVGDRRSRSRLSRTHFARHETAGKPVAAAGLARWSGQYQTITPRQQILALLDSLAQWQGEAEKGEAFALNDIKRIHVGNNVFQKTDTAAPNIVIVDSRTAW